MTNTLRNQILVFKAALLQMDAAILAIERAVADKLDEPCVEDRTDKLREGPVADRILWCLARYPKGVHVKIIAEATAATSWQSVRTTIMQRLVPKGFVEKVAAATYVATPKGLDHFEIPEDYRAKEAVLDGHSHIPVGAAGRLAFAARRAEAAKVREKRDAEIAAAVRAPSNPTPAQKIVLDILQKAREERAAGRLPPQKSWLETRRDDYNMNDPEEREAYMRYVQTVEDDEFDALSPEEQATHLDKVAREVDEQIIAGKLPGVPPPTRTFVFDTHDASGQPLHQPKPVLAPEPKKEPKDEKVYERLDF